MVIRLKPSSFFVFDLDDTLYPEIEFLYSAYKEIAERIKLITGDDVYDQMVTNYQAGEDVFQWIVSVYQSTDDEISKTNLLKIYREHLPVISLNSHTKNFLDTLERWNIPAGLITDGRSITQRNKLKSLGLEKYFTDIIISEEFGSEKPDERNYLFFQKKYAEKDFIFIGDNTLKDFEVPHKLGWFTICLKDSGRNIHVQNFNNEYPPNLVIESFMDLNIEFV